MSRDPSGIYSYPDGTRGSPGTTIFSARYNTFLDDLAVTLNSKLPINMGGTGANNVVEARDNLNAEAAGVQVTNYDMHVFEGGSFYSVPGATGAPNSTSYFSGIATILDATACFIQARDYSTGISYVRKKLGSVWEAWAIEGSSQYVELIGDTMTGSLKISAPWAQVWLNNPDNTTGALIVSSINDLNKWHAYFGEGANSDIAFYRFNDAGAIIDAPFRLSRANGSLYLTKMLEVSSAVMSASSPNSGTFYFGNSGAKYLSYNGANFFVEGGDLICSGSYHTTGAFVGGGLHLSGSDNMRQFVPAGNYAVFRQAVTGKREWFHGVHAGTGNFIITDASAGNAERLSIDVNGDVWISRNLTTGAEIIGAGGSITVRSLAGANCHYWLNDEGGIWKGILYWDRAGNQLILQHHSAGSNFKLRADGSVECGAGIRSRQGIFGGFANTYNIWWDGTAELFIDSSYIGDIVLSSDYRIKKDVKDLPSTWAAVKALRPIKYTQATYLPKLEEIRQEEEAKKAREEGWDTPETKPEWKPVPMFQADDIERWGFIAHELQETLTPSVATGVKDQPDAVQALRIDGVVAALTKALQEAMVRIEALEAKLAATAPS